MSWAAPRKCSRVEDMAYSLLGIFNVNMPLLYGEGKKAFLRLQEELVKKSDDESIFAWRSPIPDFGLLAPAATAFLHSGDVRSWAWEDDEVRRPYTMTNKGLEVHLPASSVSQISENLHLFSSSKSKSRNANAQLLLSDVKLPLNCSRRVGDSEQRVSLTLSKTSGGWRRVQCDVLTLSIPPPMVKPQTTLPERPNGHTIYVRQDHTRTNGAPSASATTEGLPGGWEMRHTYVLTLNKHTYPLS